MIPCWETSPVMDTRSEISYAKQSHSGKPQYNLSIGYLRDWTLLIGFSDLTCEESTHRYDQCTREDLVVWSDSNSGRSHERESDCCFQKSTTVPLFRDNNHGRPPCLDLRQIFIMVISPPERPLLVPIRITGATILLVPIRIIGAITLVPDFDFPRKADPARGCIPLSVLSCPTWGLQNLLKFWVQVLCTLTIWCCKWALD